MSGHLKPIHKSLPSAVKPPQTEDYVKERQAAMLRLINVWSSLAERYSRPLDEDDIVDISTGEVVKDRGVINSWDESNQGSFTTGKRKNQNTKGEEQSSARGLKGEKKQAEARKESSTGDEKRSEEWDNDFDELDSFATEVPHTTLREGVNVNRECLHDADEADEDEPSPTDPRDKEELKEFLEAENTRKELYGNDDYLSDEDLEIFRVQLRRFQNGWSRNKKGSTKPVQSEGKEFPPSSSPCPPSSSPIRATSPPASSSARATSPPASSSVRTSSPSFPPSSPSSRVSFSPQRPFSSVLVSRRASSSGRPSFSSCHASSAYRASPSSGCPSSSSIRAPSSSISASSSSIRTPSSLRMALPFSRLTSSPAPPTSSPTRASSSSIQLPPVDPFIPSSARLSTPLYPPQSSPPQSLSCLDLFAFENESEDELGVWDLPEEHSSQEEGNPGEAHIVQKFKTPESSPKRMSKRKRVISSSEEESPVRSSSLMPSLHRATSKSLSPKKRVVKGRALLPASGDSPKVKNYITLSPMLKPSRRING